MRSILESITNTSISPSQWGQASLPAALGGLGIPSAEKISSSAFLASLNAGATLRADILGASTDHPSYETAISHWKRMSGDAPLPPEPRRQRNWTYPVQRKSQADLLQGSSQSGVRRIKGCASAGSGAWLRALPSSPLGLHLDHFQLRIATALRLGSNVSQPYQCKCGVMADARGMHALSCGSSSSRHVRHSLLNGVVQRALRAAHMPSILEPAGLSRDDGKRPDGLTLVPWKRGRSLIWDATCVHRLSASYTAAARQEGAAVANIAEKRKTDKYTSLAGDYYFQPVAIETLGGIGKYTWAFTQDLGQSISMETQDKREASFLRQRLNIAVQIGNAAVLAESMRLT